MKEFAQRLARIANYPRRIHFGGLIAMIRERVGDQFRQSKTDEIGMCTSLERRGGDITVS